MSSEKWCCYCGQQGHLANKCPVPKLPRGN